MARRSPGVETHLEQRLEQPVWGPSGGLRVFLPEGLWSKDKF